MTKLEEKLQRLGYNKKRNVCGFDFECHYIKFFTEYVAIIIELNENRNQIIDCYIKPYAYIKNELDLNIQRKAFTCLQDELKMLKESIELCQN